MNDQDEMFERATETPAFLGCPQHMPTHLPGGFDGVESAGAQGGGDVPAPQDVEKLNEILFERLGEIVKKCCAMRVECDPEHVDYDAEETNIKLFGAFSELRQMCDFYKTREKPVDQTAPEMKKENKFGLLANGVQMIRFASGKMVTLIGKRERGPHERQGGRTDKIIYKVTLSRESKTAAVDIDGVNKINLISNGNGLLEHGALAMLNCIIAFNARQQRHKKARYNRRKAKAKKQ